MSELKINPRRKYLRPEKLPHFFCSGCGCGQVLNYYTQALEELDLDPEKMVHIAGVGCTARIPVYIKTDMFHGVHGRTLAWATGVKMMMPDTPVVIFAGDGDIASIGGNHLIHAARTLGMPEYKIFWKVAVPSAGPGLVAGTILTFARALGEYGATSMLAGNIPGKTGTISQRIAMVIQDGNYLTAGIWVVIIMLVAFVLIVLMNLVTGQNTKNIRRW